MVKYLFLTILKLYEITVNKLLNLPNLIIKIILTHDRVYNHQVPSFPLIEFTLVVDHPRVPHQRSHPPVVDDDLQLSWAALLVVPRDLHKWSLKGLEYSISHLP